MTRKCKNSIIDTYLLATENQESPEPFHVWTILALISAALDRKCWLDRGGLYNLYPNLYVCLVAGSARCRKSSAIKLGVRLLFKPALPEFPCCSQKITSEALLKYFNTTFKERGKCSILLVNDEMLTMFGRHAKENDLVAILTTLYDNPDEFTYETITRQKEKVSLAYPVLLTASTPHWLRQIVPTDAVGGGFTGRIVFVYQPDTLRRFPWPRITNQQKFHFSDCVEDLAQIAELSGKFHVSQEAEKVYSDWYIQIYDPKAGGELLEGYMNRKPDLVLKLAMILSVARSDKLLITVDNIVKAIGLLGENEEFLIHVMKLIEQTALGALTMAVFEFILAAKGWLGHTTVVRAFYYKVGAKELAEIISILDGARMIEVRVVQKDIQYRVKE